LLFDFDGTLVDSGRAWDAAIPRVIEEWGLGDRETSRKLIEAGKRGYDPVRTVLPHLDDGLVRKIYREARRLLLEEYFHLVRPFFTRQQLLFLLGDRPAVVVSNSHSGFIREVLGRFDLDVFDDYVGPDLTGLTKPHPGHVEYGLWLLGTNEAVLVGDSEADERAAHNAGIDFIHAKVIHRVRRHPV